MYPSGISRLWGIAKITSFHLTPTPPRNEETLGMASAPAASTYIQSVHDLMKAYKYESHHPRPPHRDLSSKGKQ